MTIAIEIKCINNGFTAGIRPALLAQIPTIASGIRTAKYPSEQ